MPKITFERVVRDCPANDQQVDPRRLINDFDVLIDGERRGVLVRDIYGQCYRLYDADRRPINPASFHKHLGHEVKKKADFLAAIEALLAADKIPPLAQLAELRAAEVAKFRAAWEERKAKLREHAQKEHAADLVVLARRVAKDVDRAAIGLGGEAARLLDAIDVTAAKWIAAEADPFRHHNAPGYLQNDPALYAETPAEAAA